MHERSHDDYQEIIEDLLRRIRTWSYLYEEQRNITMQFKDIINKYQELLDDKYPLENNTVNLQ